VRPAPRSTPTAGSLRFARDDGRLDCIEEATESGLGYFVDPVSVERAIKQLAQRYRLTDEASHRATMTDEAPERQSARGAALYADDWIASLCSR